MTEFQRGEMGGIKDSTRFFSSSETTLFCAIMGLLILILF